MTVSSSGRMRWHIWLIELIVVVSLIIAILVVATWVSRPQLDVTVSSQDAQHYLADFWPQESNGTDSYRWSHTDATVRLFGVEQRAPLLVRARLSASRKPDQPLAQLTIVSAGAPLTFPIQREWRRYM